MHHAYKGHNVLNLMHYAAFKGLVVSVAYVKHFSAGVVGHFLIFFDNNHNGTLRLQLAQDVKSIRCHYLRVQFLCDLYEITKLWFSKIKGEVIDRTHAL